MLSKWNNWDPNGASSPQLKIVPREPLAYGVFRAPGSSQYAEHMQHRVCSTRNRSIASPIPRTIIGVTPSATVYLSIYTSASVIIDYLQIP